MKRAAGVLLLVLLAAHVAGAQPAPVVDAAGYRAELDRVRAALDDPAAPSQRLADTAKSLPPVWVVRTEQQQFAIPIGWLGADLRRLSAKPDATALATVRRRLERLRADLDAYQAQPRPAAAERHRLDRILARAEFRGVHGPTWFDRLKQRVLEYVLTFLIGIWGSSSFPTIANIVVWSLVGLAVLITGFWIVGSLRRPSAADAPAPDVVPVSAKDWAVWLAEARLAAARGEWSNAVRLTYWSGISWLESARVWPPDRARTPREYLRLLPAESAHRPALSSLSRAFELAWYAGQDADADTYSRAVQDLERLGCRPQLDRTDRRILTIAGIVFLALVIGASLLATGADLDIPTSYSAASGGARAAYRLLEESGYAVARWERPLDQLGPGARTTLILADPSGMANQSERTTLQQFVAGGGRLLVTGNNLPLFLADNTLSPEPLLGSAWTRAQAASPAGLTRAAREITIVPQAHAEPNPDIVPLYAEAGRTVVAKYAIGNGEVIWWASAMPLTNAGIREPGNLEFFLACVGGPGERTVLWDEYVHGFRQSLAATASHSAILWLFVQAGVIVLAVLLTFSRRSGPILLPRRDTRLSPLEFVQTLGGLYQRARVASVAVDICHQRFRHRLARRLGVPRDASPEHLARALEERWKFGDDDFVPTLDACTAASANPAIKPKQALRLVQALYSYATKLKLYGP